MSKPVLRGFQPNIKDKAGPRNAIVSIRRDCLSFHNASHKFHVATRQIKSGINSLKAHEELRGAPLREDSNKRQVYRWATKFTGVKEKTSKLAYTKWELEEAMFHLLTGDSRSYNDASLDLGVPRRTFDRHMKLVLSFLKIKSFRVCQQMAKAKEITRAEVRSAIKNVHARDIGRPSYLTRDKKVMVIAVSKLKAAHSVPSLRRIVGEKLHTILQTLGKRTGDVSKQSKQAYARAVIRRVNKREEEQFGQTKQSSTGQIKVQGLSHKRAKQSDPRLQWIMFHKMVRMCRDVKRKEEANAEKLTNGGDDSARKGAAESLISFSTSLSLTPSTS